MNSRHKAVLSEIRSLLRLDRFRRFGLPLGLVLVIAVLCYVNWQQEQTIAAQSELIHTLFQDSLELSAKRMQQSKPRAADFKKPSVNPSESSSDHKKKSADQQ